MATRAKIQLNTTLFSLKSTKLARSVHKVRAMAPAMVAVGQSQQNQASSVPTTEIAMIATPAIRS